LVPFFICEHSIFPNKVRNQKHPKLKIHSDDKLKDDLHPAKGLFSNKNAGKAYVLATKTAYVGFLVFILFDRIFCLFHKV